MFQIIFGIAFAAFGVYVAYDTRKNGVSKTARAQMVQRILGEKRAKAFYFGLGILVVILGIGMVIASFIPDA